MRVLHERNCLLSLFAICSVREVARASGTSSKVYDLEEGRSSSPSRRGTVAQNKTNQTLNRIARDILRLSLLSPLALRLRVQLPEVGISPLTALPTDGHANEVEGIQR